MFSIIEGANGCGKTTLIKNLSRLGYKTISSPNGTPLAKTLRPMARGTGEWKDLDGFVKFLLFSAARTDEFLREVKDREFVVADRWWTSTFVYQCILEGIDVSRLEATIHSEEKIDFVVVLTADFQSMLARIKKDRAENPSHGNCTWIQEESSLRRIKDIYENEFKGYLTSRGIPVYYIDTDKMTPEMVLDEFLKLKDFYGTK